MKILTLCTILGSLSRIPAAEVPVLDLSTFEFKNAKTEVTNWLGVSALKMVEAGRSPGEAFARIKGQIFHDGTIEVDVAGKPGMNAGPLARGFIGVAFRIQADGKRMENIYVRPANGRAPDQVRRNHTLQYVSVPDWPWERLRKEYPEMYESYADMDSGEWVHLRIVVRGTAASLYVGEAKRPNLIVNDLKLGDSTGGVALWIGPGTEGYFRNLRISAEGANAPK